MNYQKHDNFGSKIDVEEQKRSKDNFQDIIVKQVTDHYTKSRQDNIYQKDEDPPHLVAVLSSNKDSKERRPVMIQQHADGASAINTS
jgi:hypothetical protein